MNNFVLKSLRAFLFLLAKRERQYSMLASKKQFLSPIEAAEVAQCSRRTIYRMIESDQLKAAKFGKYWKIDRQAFYKLLGIESQDYARTA